MVNINRSYLLYLSSLFDESEYPNVLVIDFGNYSEGGKKIRIEDKDKFADNFIKKMEEFLPDFDISLRGYDFTRSLKKEEYEITLDLFYLEELNRGVLGWYVLYFDAASKKPMKLPDEIEKEEKFKVYEISKEEEIEEFDVFFYFEGVLLVSKSLKYLDNIPTVQAKIISQTELTISPIDPKLLKSKFEEHMNKIYEAVNNVINFFQ